MTTAYDELKKLLGKHEVRDNKILKDWLKKYAVKGDISIDPKDTAWCAAAVNAAERAAGNEGNGKLNARSFLTYKTAVYDKAKGIGKPDLAKKGDIAIFERGGSTWMGHVAYVDGLEIGKDGTKLVRTLGGNQSDSVSIGWYPVSRLLGIRRT